MQWNVPFERLSQRQIAVLEGVTRQSAKPHWIKGFAGTGKTVVLTRVIERIAAEHPTASLCFITYTHALKDLVATGFHGPVAARVIIMTHTQFLSEGKPRDFVFLDEVQDIPEADLRRIRSLARSLHVAGDPDQSIYDNGAGEPAITALLKPQAWTLKEMFRLTRKLADLALGILPASRIVEGIHDGRQRNADIHLFRFDDENEEAAWVWSEAKRHARAGSPSVILLPTHRAIADFAASVAEAEDVAPPPEVRPAQGRGRDYGPFNACWESAGLPLRYFGSGHGSLLESDARPLVYLMTYHSSKGLDFETVFVPGVHDDMVIVNSKAMQGNPDVDRRLLFVAVTRSRERLFLTYAGRRPHRYLAGLRPEEPPAGSSSVDTEEFF